MSTYQADPAATRAYYKANPEQCDCLYCENYRRAFPVHFPEIVKFLDNLGLSCGHALEIMECGWNEAKDLRLYYAYYPVQGRLEEDTVFYLEGVTLHRAESACCPRPTMAPPYFIVEVCVQLPWVLEETP